MIGYPELHGDVSEPGITTVQEKNGARQGQQINPKGWGLPVQARHLAADNDEFCGMPSRPHI